MKNNEVNSLNEIPHSDWRQLRDMYLGNWPHNCVGFYTIDNFMRWLDKDPNVRHLKVYSLNGDWSDGTFLVVDRYQLFLNSLNESNGRLTIALSLLDWSHGFNISSFLERHRPAVIEVIDRYQLNKKYDICTVFYYMPKKEASELEISPSENIVLKPLSVEHAIIIDELWRNRHEGSHFFIKRLIEWNVNFGAFDANTNELLAWCLRCQAGALAVLQVKEECKRRGLGTLVAKAMCKELAEMGHDTFALVFEKNIASRTMFERLGFKHTDNTFWLRTLPTVPFSWSDE